LRLERFIHLLASWLLKSHLSLVDQRASLLEASIIYHIAATFHTTVHLFKLRWLTTIFLFLTEQHAEQIQFVYRKSLPKMIPTTRQSGFCICRSVARRVWNSKSRHSHYSDCYDRASYLLELLRRTTEQSRKHQDASQAQLTEQMQLSETRKPSPNMIPMTRPRKG